MITADQLKDIQERAEALHRYLDIDRKRVELEEEEQALKGQAWERAQKSARIVERLREAVLIGWSLVCGGPGQGFLRCSGVE